VGPTMGWYRRLLRRTGQAPSVPKQENDDAWNEVTGVMQVQRGQFCGLANDGRGGRPVALPPACAQVPIGGGPDTSRA